jgi:hypothetical protein
MVDSDPTNKLWKTIYIYIFFFDVNKTLVGYTLFALKRKYKQILIYN